MKHAGHLPTTQDCSICHVPGTFLNAFFDHTGIFDNCASCHNGTNATGMPPVPLEHPDPLGKDCSICHNTTAFIGASYDHTGIVDGCATCHDGNTAIGMDAKTNPAHWPTSRDCSDCHTTATFLSGTWIHEVNSAGQCDSCHSQAGGARTKPAGHLSTTSQCDVCHSTNGWVPSNFSHDPNGNYPGDHRRQPTCSACHGATISATIPYPFTAYTPDCAACHANDFEPKDKHIGGESGTIQQNKDCASAGCHSVRDDEF